MSFLQEAAVGGSIAALFVIACLAVMDLVTFFEARGRWRAQARP